MEPVATEYELHNPDGRHVVYVADQETDELIELFANPLPEPAKAEEP